MTEEEPVEPIAPPEDVPPVSAERLVDGELPTGEVDGEEPRRYPSTIGGAFYLVVLAMAGVGLGIVTWGDWRTGVQVLAAGFGLAAVSRLVLPNREAGMLAVRAKWLDVLILAGTAVALVYLVRTIPSTFDPGVLG